MLNARLLLVLDEKKSGEIQTTLLNLGYQIAGNVSTGTQALDCVAELSPDLVLIQMYLEGDKDGIQVGKHINDEYDIPIIYIADQSSQATLRRSAGTAPFGYLFGELDEKQILAIIEVALTRHSMEKKIRESESWLNAILSSITEGLIAVDNGQCVRFMNPVAEKITGKNSVEVLGHPIEDVLNLHYANSDEPVTITHAMGFFNDQKERTGFEASLTGNNGTRVPVEVFISQINENGKPIGMVLSFRDISERKRTESEINQHARRTESMLRAAEQLNARLDVNAVLNLVCEICNTTLNTTATASFLLDPQRNVLMEKAIALQQANLLDASPDEGYEIPVDLVGNFISKSNPIFTVRNIQDLDLPEIPYIEYIKKQDIRSLAIAGLFNNDALTGILVAKTFGEFREFTQEDLDLLRGFADQASIAVSNSILFEQVLIGRERQQTLTRRLVDLQEEERRHLARDLHDQIGQMLTGLQFSLSALLPDATEKQKQGILDAQDQVRNLISQTREISMNLRPIMLDDTGLILTLLWHFGRFKAQTEIKVNLKHHNILDKRFDSSIETAIFRIIQEALTNAARYAECDEIDVMVQLEDKHIKIEIRDNGQGFDPDQVNTSTSVGLSSMKERAHTVGGLLEINAAPGQGTLIQAVIPYEGQVERRLHER